MSGPPKNAPAHQNPDEIIIDELEDGPDVTQVDEGVESRTEPEPAYPSTKFMALDKCLPKRRYLEV